MDRVRKIVLVTLLGVTLSLSSVVADAEKGQKIYLEKLKATCGMSADTFAQKHTQNEWESIRQAGKFVDEAIKICPNVNLDATFIPDVYDFVYEYASDSGNIPSR